jgi:hypothetical protein
VTDYVGPTRWRWELSDSGGHFLAYHEVHLDPTSREYCGFVDLGAYLEYHEPIAPVEEQLDRLGRWIGEQVFGRLREALWEHRARPAVAVHLAVPLVAEELLLRPFELARFADGTPFREAGVRFVYQLEGAATGAKAAVGEALRVLAAFSLPVDANSLNLRRERYGLQRLVRELSQTRGLAVELRVLQYGATRVALRDALEDDEGWDVIHLSGHGEHGVLLLEDEWGGTDPIEADALGELLDPARARLKLLVLGAGGDQGSHSVPRLQADLDQIPIRRVRPTLGADPETTQIYLPSLAQVLSHRLDCAVLAMRYPVGDAFATDLVLALYEKLLDRRQALPAALHLALDDALAADILKPPLSAATPILVGPRAADLRLAPPQRAVQALLLPEAGLGIAFPPEPERFVGQVGPLLRASRALAPQSAMRGVLFYGLPGVGKTTCALELAYRHAEERFQGYVWYRAPEAGSDVAGELHNALLEIETQLNAPELGLTTAVDDAKRFRGFTLPRLRALLGVSSLLLVLDNLDTLLTASNRWRDPLWGDFVAALLSHDGPSRAVLTSRRLPADLENHPRLQVEIVRELSFAESVVLTRELPHLRRLFEDEGGRALLQETLEVVRGRPQLLALADDQAADRAALEHWVASGIAYADAPRSLLLTKVELVNIRCFQELAVSLASEDGPISWAMVLGDNASGKTTLLRSIALGLCRQSDATALIKQIPGDFVRRGEKEGQVTLRLREAGGARTYTITTRISKTRDAAEEIVQQETDPSEFPWSGVFVCGYGPHRATQAYTSYPEYAARDAVLSLFNYDTPLQNPEVVLRRREPLVREQLERRLLRVLMLDSPECEISYESTGLALRGPWGRMPLRVLSDGYRSTSQWVLDFLGWLLYAGRPADSSYVGGILLIDEIEQHLHPRWQRHIAQRMQKQFPGTQIVATTHTPLVASGIADVNRGLLLKLTQEPDGIVREQVIDRMSLAGKRADQVLASDAFGLVTTRNPGSESDFDRFAALLGKADRTPGEEADLQALRSSLKKSLSLGESEISQAVEQAVRQALGDLLHGVSAELVDMEIKRQIRDIFWSEVPE